TDQRILGNVLRVEEPRHAPQRGKATGPVEQRPRVVGSDDRVGEAHGPVHAAAEWLVLRVPTPAETELFHPRTRVARARRVILVDERNGTSDALRTVAGHTDLWSPRDLDLLARFATVYGETEGP